MHQQEIAKTNSMWVPSSWTALLRPSRGSQLVSIKLSAATVTLLLLAALGGSDRVCAKDEGPIGTRWAPRLHDNRDSLREELLQRLKRYVDVEQLLKSSERSVIDTPIAKATDRLEWRLITGTQYAHLYQPLPGAGGTLGPLDYTPYTIAVRQPLDETSKEGAKAYYREVAGPTGHVDGEIKDSFQLPMDFHEPVQVGADGRVDLKAPRRVPLLKAADNTYRRRTIVVIPISSVAAFKKFKLRGAVFPQYMLFQTELVFRDNGPDHYQRR